MEQYFSEQKIPQTRIEKKYNGSLVHSVFPIHVVDNRLAESQFNVDNVFESLSTLCDIYIKHFESKAKTRDHEMPTPLSLYKQDLPSFWEDEKYKWEAVKQFQDNWDIDAENFGEMFKVATSKHVNLLASMNYFPVGMILNFAEYDQERTRNMFRTLYDESRNLAERINSFIDESEAIRKTHDSEWRNHYQDLRAISAYLLFRYPEKYYIYKYTELKKTVDILGDSFSFKGKSDNGTFYASCVEYLNGLCARLVADEDLQSMMHERLDNDNACYNDDARHITTTDFFFLCGKTA